MQRAEIVSRINSRELFGIHAAKSLLFWVQIRKGDAIWFCLRNIDLFRKFPTLEVDWNHDHSCNNHQCAIYHLENKCLVTELNFLQEIKLGRQSLYHLYQFFHKMKERSRTQLDMNKQQCIKHPFRQHMKR